MATSSNPAFKNAAFGNGGSKATTTPSMSVEQLDELYGRPAAGPSDTNRMSYEDTIVKTAVAFGILLVGAAIGWFIPILAIPAAIAGFVLALVNTFKKRPSPALILIYAALEGVFVGGLSFIFESIWEGVAIQAVLATLSVFAVTLVLFANGKIRASKKATKVFMIAAGGYLVFSLVNAGLMIFGATDTMFGLRGTEIGNTGISLGFVLGILAILMAAYSLVLDFDFVQRGVRGGLDRVFGWQAAFGLVTTVVWLYIEMIRLIAILRGSE